MKIRLTAMMLILTLGILSGCTVSALQPESTVPSPAVISAAPAATPAEPAPNSTEPAPAAIPTEPAPAAPAAAETVPPYLSREEALAIALKDAGFTQDQVTRLRAEFDYDDGVPEYDVEFRHDGWEYEYEIHAESGRILKQDKDRDD